MTKGVSHACGDRAPQFDLRGTSREPHATSKVLVAAGGLRREGIEHVAVDAKLEELPLLELAWVADLLEQSTQRSLVAGAGLWHQRHGRCVRPGQRQPAGHRHAEQKQREGHGAAAPRAGYVRGGQGRPKVAPAGGLQSGRDAAVGPRVTLRAPEVRRLAPHLYLQSYPERVLPATLERFLAGVERAVPDFERPYAWITDLERPEKISKTHQKIIAAFEARVADLDRRYCAASALVVQRGVIRAVMSAVFWVHPPVYPFRLVASREEALEACVGGLRAQGVSVDAASARRRLWEGPPLIVPRKQTRLSRRAAG